MRINPESVFKLAIVFLPITGETGLKIQH